MEEDQKIILYDEEGNEIELYVLEETKFNGIAYILATDVEEDEDGECYVLKDVALADESEAKYEFVTDDAEMDCMFNIFTQLLDDADTDIVK